MRVPHLSERDGAFVADDATVVGKVTLGTEVSVWYGVVIRGDVAAIAIGDRTNVQDLTCIHPQHDEDVAIGRDVVIGHGALVHGRAVGDRCLIGMGAILLAGSRIGAGCLVGAGAVVPPGMEVPPGSLVVGSPAKVVRKVREDEHRMIADSVARYLDLAREHLRGGAAAQ